MMRNTSTTRSVRTLRKMMKTSMMKKVNLSLMTVHRLWMKMSIWVRLTLLTVNRVTPLAPALSPHPQLGSRLRRQRRQRQLRRQQQPQHRPRPQPQHHHHHHHLAQSSRSFSTTHSTSCSRWLQLSSPHSHNRLRSSSSSSKISSTTSSSCGRRNATCRRH